jgi:hypothetical protein
MLGGFAQVTLTIGLSPSTPLNAIFDTRRSHFSNVPIGPDGIREKIAGFRPALDHMYKNVEELSEERRDSKREPAHVNRPHANFLFGHYFLLGTPFTEKPKKSQSLGMVLIT